MRYRSDPADLKEISLEVQKHYVSKITATKPEEWGSGVRSQNLALFMTKTTKINASSKTKMA